MGLGLDSASGPGLALLLVSGRGGAGVFRAPISSSLLCWGLGMFSPASPPPHLRLFLCPGLWHRTRVLSWGLLKQPLPGTCLKRAWLAQGVGWLPLSCSLAHWAVSYRQGLTYPATDPPSCWGQALSYVSLGTLGGSGRLAPTTGLALGNSEHLGWRVSSTSRGWACMSNQGPSGTHAVVLHSLWLPLPHLQYFSKK